MDCEITRKVDRIDKGLPIVDLTIKVSSYHEGRKLRIGGAVITQKEYKSE